MASRRHDGIALRGRRPRMRRLGAPRGRSRPRQQQGGCMKIIGKIVAAAAVAALATTALAGCTQRGSTDDASEAPGTSTEEVSVAFVPKLQGIPYFEAMNTGGQAAA